jgi:hypothetical protein
MRFGLRAFVRSIFELPPATQRAKQNNLPCKSFTAGAPHTLSDSNNVDACSAGTHRGPPCRRSFHFHMGDREVSRERRVSVDDSRGAIRGRQRNSLFRGIGRSKRSDMERQRIGRNSDREGRHSQGLVSHLVQGPRFVADDLRQSDTTQRDCAFLFADAVGTVERTSDSVQPHA